MGMFDTFIVERDGEKIEIQTKELDCLLTTFNLGDRVPSISKNIHSFTIIEDDYPIQRWFGLIIYRNIYLDFVELVNMNDDKAVTILRTYSENPKLVASRLIEIIDIKNSQIEKLEKKIFDIESAVLDFDEFKKNGFEYENEKMKNFLTFMHKNADFFKNGGELHDLIKEKLNLNIEKIIV